MDGKVFSMFFRIKHQQEADSKSTAIHAKMLAPQFVTIYEFPAVPDYDRSRVVLVYPHDVGTSIILTLSPVFEDSTLLYFNIARY